MTSKTTLKWQNKISDIFMLIVCRISLALFAFLIIMLISIMIVDHSKRQIITDGKIERSFEDIVKHLSSEPEDLFESTYATNIPKLVRKDIQTMLNSVFDLEIVYHSNDNLSQIVICKDKSSPTGINMHISVPDDKNKLWDANSNISIYKDNADNIVVYGSYYDALKDNGPRKISKYIISEENVIICPAAHIKYHGYYDLFPLTEDLYIVDSNRQMTLVKVGNNFRLYQNGKNILEKTFPGGEIAEITPWYILNSNNDLYYLYYCTDLSNPWIEFVKVAENVEDSYNLLDYAHNVFFLHDNTNEPMTMAFPIYTKDGEKYTSISNIQTEKRYGIKQSWCLVDSSTDEPDFSITTINLGREKVNGYTLTLNSNDGLWHILHHYTVGENTGYIDEIVEQLNKYPLHSLPTDGFLELFPELEELNGKTFSSSETSQLYNNIARLNTLYSKFYE